MREQWTHDDICLACGDGGELLMCNLCPTAYHLKCIGAKEVRRCLSLILTRTTLLYPFSFTFVYMIFSALPNMNTPPSLCHLPPLPPHSLPLRFLLALGVALIMRAASAKRRARNAATACSGELLSAAMGCVVVTQSGLRCETCPCAYCEDCRPDEMSFVPSSKHRFVRKASASQFLSFAMYAAAPRRNVWFGVWCRVPRMICCAGVQGAWQRSLYSLQRRLPRCRC
jgi:hypothetical protein